MLHVTAQTSMYKQNPTTKFFPSIPRYINIRCVCLHKNTHAKSVLFVLQQPLQYRGLSKKKKKTFCLMPRLDTLISEYFQN